MGMRVRFGPCSLAVEDIKKVKAQLRAPHLEIMSDELGWMFYPTPWIPNDSAWLGHIPFAHWLVATAKPSKIVELGTHSGASYSAFCEAVTHSRVFTKCWAVDTWLGDAHSGPYSEGVFQELSEFHRRRYGMFSKLMRTTFDDAVLAFSDGSIDLLHIDGLHTYEAVKHDFETWLPKLSSRSVVLFHDTSERHDDFGVWRLWEELTQVYPSFQFLHSHGLGVLQVGPDAPAESADLFAIHSVEDISKVRYRFQFLGEQVMMRSSLLAFRGQRNRS